MNFNYRLTIKIVAYILIFEALGMLIPLFTAVHYNEIGEARSFLFTILICVTVGLALRRFIHKESLRLKTRQAFFTVIASWLFVILIASIPYYFAGNGYSFSACWLESTAGWTTTGCSAIPFDHLPRSLILWKVITGWVGGMGIIVMTISLFPRLGIGGQVAASAEVPGAELEKLTARMSDTAKISYRIYILMTILEFLLLLSSKMKPYYALVNTLSTMSTSGIVDLSTSHGGFIVTPEIKLILGIFTLFSSTSFTVYYALIHKNLRAVKNNYEVRTYYVFVFFMGLLVSISLLLSGTYHSTGSALGNGILQTLSFSSTSGFMIDHLNTWPTAAKLILLLCMLIGGCSFSTSSGLKIQRFIICLKVIKRGIYKGVHPNAICPIRIGTRNISAKTVSEVSIFVLLYFGLLSLSTLIIGLENQDLETTFSIVTAAFTNNGNAFGKTSGGDFSFLSGCGKGFVSILMLAGRLEIYTVLVLFSRSFWNMNRTDTRAIYDNN